MWEIFHQSRRVLRRRTSSEPQAPQTAPLFPEIDGFSFVWVQRPFGAGVMLVLV
jgi:hypothetical protein